MAKHFPITVEGHSKLSPDFKVVMPILKPPYEPRGELEDEFCFFAVEIYEWLSMLTLSSPRVATDDHIDPFLSRYVPPITHSAEPEAELIKVTWEGFISASWAHMVFAEILLAATAETWFAFALSGFGDSLSQDGKDCMVLKLPGNSNEYLMWEVEQ